MHVPIASNGEYHNVIPIYYRTTHAHILSSNSRVRIKPYPLEEATDMVAGLIQKSELIGGDIVSFVVDRPVVGIVYFYKTAI